MANYWTSFNWSNGLQSRISTLPLVIAGPILRRVTPDSVSVWVALKSQQTVTLKVYDSSNNEVISDSISTIALGSHLHVCVVTAASSSVIFTPGTNYTYNLFFTNGSNLGSAGILNNSNSSSGAMSLITYGSFTRPSFSLPPTDFSKLRIVHGSCRKPHGEGKDALEGVHTMIESVINDPASANKRPHQLFLTGDQIYADDVGDALLHMIIDADKHLIDRAETLPGIAGDPPLPGKRVSIMKGYAQFTPDDYACKSHLMKLSEYYCMYLFVWSPVLWPAVLPDFATVRPNDPQTKLTYSRNVQPSNTEEYTTFVEEQGYLNTFKSTLANVRKALANVPVYMIFDDHDVTDDWFLNGAWQTKVYASPLGKRIVTNGLAAYAVFQDWGNLSARYLNPMPGKNLLNLLGATPTVYNNVESLILPVFNATDKRMEHTGTQLDWHYTVPMDKYEVIVLDPRTMRAYPTPESCPGLISDAGMVNQIPPLSVPAQTTNELTILIAPAPVFGVPRVEDLQLFIAGTEQAGLEENDVEGWGFRRREHDTLQYLISHLVDRTDNGSPKRGRVLLLSGDVHYSFSIRTEYWATKPRTKPLNFTGNFNLILAQLTASSLKNQVKSVTGTYNCHYAGYRLLRDALPDTKKVFGYRTGAPLTVGTRTIVDNQTSQNYTTPIKVSQYKPILDYERDTKDIVSPDMNITNSFSIAPHWSYRIDYIRDTSGEVRPNMVYTKTVVPAPPYANRAAALQTYLAQASNSWAYNGLWGSGKEIVGKNNIGEISFSLDANSKLKSVFHTIWWQLRSNANSNTFLGMFPLTKHEISLEYGNGVYPMPQP